MNGVTGPARVAIFVDGANLFKSAAELRVPIDFAFLKKRLSANRNLVSATYFGSYKPEPTEDDDLLQTAIREAGFDLVLRPLKVEYFPLKAPPGARVQVTYESGFDPRMYREKGVDVALVTEMLSRAWDDAYDVAVLVSGDGDYVRAVRELIRHAKNVEVVSFLHSASRELRGSAKFVDLAQLLS